MRCIICDSETKVRIIKSEPICIICNEQILEAIRDFQEQEVVEVNDGDQDGSEIINP